MASTREVLRVRWHPPELSPRGRRFHRRSAVQWQRGHLQRFHLSRLRRLVCNLGCGFTAGPDPVPKKSAGLLQAGDSHPPPMARPRQKPRIPRNHPGSPAALIGSRCPALTCPVARRSSQLRYFPALRVRSQYQGTFAWSRRHFQATRRDHEAHCRTCTMTGNFRDWPVGDRAWTATRLRRGNMPRGRVPSQATRARKVLSQVL